MESSLRNAEVLQALGMTEQIVGALAHAAKSSGGDADRVPAAAALPSRAGTRFVRQAIQVLMLALGAYLVLSQQASAGVMIATTILLGRAVQPVEQLVASWRTLIDARAAYQRLLELSVDFEQPERAREPAASGRAAHRRGRSRIASRARIG